MWRRPGKKSAATSAGVGVAARRYVMSDRGSRSSLSGCWDSQRATSAAGAAAASMGQRFSIWERSAAAFEINLADGRCLRQPIGQHVVRLRAVEPSIPVTVGCRIDREDDLLDTAGDVRRVAP